MAASVKIGQDYRPCCKLNLFGSLLFSYSALFCGHRKDFLINNNRFGLHYGGHNFTEALGLASLQRKKAGKKLTVDSAGALHVCRWKKAFLIGKIGLVLQTTILELIYVVLCG